MDEKISIMEAFKVLTESIKAWADKHKVEKTTIGDLSLLETNEKTNVVFAINEAAKTGGVSSDDVSNAIEKYVNENPVDLSGVVKSVNGKTGEVTLPVLPTVTASDNGKVLMVVNGAWAVVDISLTIDSDGVLSV